jgi:hypothetical protein
MPKGSSVARFKRIVRIASVALAAVFVSVSNAAIAEQPQQRIVAVGDLHGDFQAWQNISQGAGIADRNGHWSGGKTILVQLGDVTDRGPDC